MKDFIKRSLWKWCVCALPFIFFFCMKAPDQVDKRGWVLCGIFISTILGFIIKPVPMGQFSLLSFSICIFFKFIDLNSALSGFSSPTTWLVVSVFFIAQGVIKTGLSNRIAYIFIKTFGKNVVGLTYSIVITDFLIAPFIPTAGAKTGSIVVPVINSISENAKGSKQQKKDLKEFLFFVYSHVVSINSSIFLFATSSSVVAYKIMKSMDIHISWLNWLHASIVPGIVSLTLMPFLIFIFYRKKIDTDFQFQQTAKIQLTNIGRISQKELTTLLVLIFSLLLWINADRFKINVTTTALVGTSLMLLFNVISFKDVISNTNAWNTLIWFSITMMFSEQLYKYNVLQYFSYILSTFLYVYSWKMSLLIISVLYFYSHYFFAGGATHVSAFYGIFLSLCIFLKCPINLSALVLAFVSNLFSSLNHYSSISSAILFEQIHVSTQKWCMYSFFFSSAIFLIWILIGYFWWQYIGLF